MISCKKYPNFLKYYGFLVIGVGANKKTKKGEKREKGERRKGGKRRRKREKIIDIGSKSSTLTNNLLLVLTSGASFARYSMSRFIKIKLCIIWLRDIIEELKAEEQALELMLWIVVTFTICIKKHFTYIYA